VLAAGGDDAKSIGALRDIDADVLCLTELTPRFARAFDAALGARYPHRALHPKDGTWGVGIVSKHRIVRQQRFPQAPDRMPAVEATIRVGDVDVQVACVHLFPPGGARAKGDDRSTTMDKNAQLRRQQADGLVQRFARAPAPMVMLGDFNEAREGAALGALFAAGFAHACAGEDARCGPTWPGATSSLPAVAEIDHILARGGRLHGARRVKAGGSDHYPVSARLSLRP
jgi:endonuclease/exonuclease/phosphatase (EEP) superfamily protein YafD